MKLGYVHACRSRRTVVGTYQQSQVMILRPQDNGCVPPEPKIENRESERDLIVHFYLLITKSIWFKDKIVFIVHCDNYEWNKQISFHF